MTIPIALPLLLGLVAGPFDPAGSPPPPLAGVVDAVGERSRYYPFSPLVAVVGADGVRRTWRADLVTVAFAGRSGSWGAESLLPGDRVEAAAYWAPYWEATPVLTVLESPDRPDSLFRLAVERSVVGFRRASGSPTWPPPRSVAPPGLLGSLAGLGAPCYLCRERAGREVGRAGGAALRGLVWAESHRDPEVRNRAAALIVGAVGGDVTYRARGEELPW